MFALLAAVLFVVAACNIPGDLTSAPWFWGFLALGALALHFAYAVAIPNLQNRRQG